MYYICHTLEDKCMSSRITSLRQRRRFLRGVPESGTSLSVDSSAVSLTALTSVMTDNRPGDPGGRWTSVLCTKPRCMKGDMRPESGFFFFPALLSCAMCRYRNGFLRHLSCSVGKRWHLGPCVFGHNVLSFCFCTPTQWI